MERVAHSSIEVPQGHLVVPLCLRAREVSAIMSALLENEPPEDGEDPTIYREKIAIHSLLHHAWSTALNANKDG